MRRRTRSFYLALAVLLALIVAGASLPGARAQSSNRVGLVVRFGDGSTITRCVEFSEPQISGYDVLMRSGLSVVAAYFSGEGTAICAIEGTGCPVGECLTCDYPNYWSYWHLVSGDWSYSQVGASGYNVHPGDVEGWSWGAGDTPPVVPFDQICAPPPTDTPPPSDTPLPTDTPLPPTATSPPPTPVAWFRLDDNPISANACTMVRWDTTNASEVYLDGESVDANGSVEVCPTAPQEYHLRVVGTAGEETHTLVLGVTGAPPATSPPEPTASVSSSSTPTPQPTASAAPTTAPAPSPSPTPQSIAAVSPSPSHIPPPESTPAPSPTPRPTRSTPTIPQPATTDRTLSNSPVGYVVFGLVAIGLLGWFVFGLLRRR